MSRQVNVLFLFFFCIESKNLMVDETWLDKPKVDETAAKWNVCSEEGNNNLEGWHSKVKQIADKNHLNIFGIVELLKKQQNRLQQKVKLGSWWQGGPEGDRHHIEEIKTLESKPL